MERSIENSSVVCFGEVLWDMLPMGAKPGGAPMNVAYHLNQLGLTTHLVSRVGHDEPGRKLLSILNGWGLSTALCQLSPDQPTSEVHVVLREQNEVHYDILFPVAWDYISLQPEVEPLLAQADALVFGSLSTRNEQSRKTLYAMLEMSRYNVFDVNLRVPHYKPDIIRHLLSKTNLLKLNTAELEILAGWYHGNCSTEEEQIQVLQDAFPIGEILVTKGSRGASYYTAFTKLDCSAFGVTVADTVGSGDSFLAAFLAKKLQKEAPDVALAYAAALAGFVTMHHGACPTYDTATLEAFMWRKFQKIVL
ncbi:carbohydrate kinase [Pontibacter qinzhouensis]|uniref:Carbohydrate kinase n=1 Tax=Pontibacter qinzhouensis TaxID=2603253 RepID=A0A5C8K587_9BACT|nr:carbohydrate kinase [Pontibacter qinzhouensis]TXK44852.1 carbohydrate kinase [Pontibacter qinzhouensis]